MIYSMNNLLSENYSTIDPDIVKVQPEYTNNIFQLVREAALDYNKALQTLYININESFAAVDFLKSNTSIVNAFINNLNQIKDIFNRDINSFFIDNKDEIKYIRDNKSKLSKLGSNTIKMNGYLYTETLQPNVYIVNEFVDQLFDVLDKDIVEVYGDLKHMIMNSYYDDLRKAILESSNTIPAKEFSSRVYEYFRNGQNDSQNISISSHYLSTFVNNFNKEYYIKNVNEYIDEIIDQFKEVLKMLSDFTKSKYIESKKELLDIVMSPSIDKAEYLAMYNKEASDKLDDEFNQYLFLILKIKSQQIVKMMEIYGTTISGKINAVNEAITQNKILCIVALDYLERQQ